MPSGKVLIVEEERLVRWSLRQALESSAFEVEEASNAEQALAELRRFEPDLILLDVRVLDAREGRCLAKIRRLAPHLPIIVTAAYGCFADAVSTLKQGVFEILEKPVHFGRLLHSIRNSMEMADFRRGLGLRLQDKIRRFAFDSLVGESHHIRRLRRHVMSLARRPRPQVFLSGAIGVGKRLTAHILHYQSPRRLQPFLSIDCSGTESVDSLFAIPLGSPRGILSRCRGGTLYLKRVSSLPIRFQERLAPLVAATEREKDVPVVILSDRSSPETLLAGQRLHSAFRRRLSDQVLQLPPLRQRRDDLPLLCAHFAARFSKHALGQAHVSLRSLRWAREYDWPGNVAELRILMQRAALLQAGPELDFHLRGQDDDSLLTVDSRFQVQFSDQGVDLYEIEKGMVREALRRARGNQTQAARLLSISRDTLRYKVKKYHLGG